MPFRSRLRPRWLSRWSGRLSGIRARVAAFVFVTASAALLITSAVISNQVLGFHRREFDSELYNLVLDVGEEVRFDLFGNPAPPRGGFSFRRRSLPFSEGFAFFQVLNLDGQIVYRSPGLGKRLLPWSPMDWTTLLDEDVVFRNLQPAALGLTGPAPFRVISVPILDEDSLRGVLQLAVSVESIEREKEQLEGMFGMLIPILVGTLALGSYWIAGSALIPLRELIARTRRIAPDDLSVRLPIPDSGDEIAELSRTLNGLLSRLGTAFHSQERFIADASHQLKTPLAVLRGEIELLQARTPGAQEIKDFLNSAHEEVRHLTKLVEGLLILARVSAMPEAALVRTPVRLDETLVGILERQRSWLAQRGIKCRFHAQEDTDFETRGDEDLLRSLFETLIENAVKYSPEGGTIDVRLEFASERPLPIQVLIVDQGRGIPENQREQVFERFYRGETGSQGFGLGLTIARQIARAHGGEIRIEGAGDGGTPGTCIRVEMKKFSS